MAQAERIKRPYRMVVRAANAQATEQRILAAARTMFRAQMYDQVSLQAVAREAGVTVQTVLRRFGSKEQLFAAMAALLSATYLPFRDLVAAGDIAAAVGILADQYEEVGDEWLHEMAQEERTEPIRVAVEAGRVYHHAWVQRIFGPLLHDQSATERRVRLGQLIVATDLYTWKLLRRDLGLDRDEYRRAMEDLIGRIVT